MSYFEESVAESAEISGAILGEEGAWWGAPCL